MVRVNGMYKCDQCERTFMNKGLMNIHRQSAHEGDQYSCEQCGTQFTEKGNLKKHIKSKH